MPRVSIIIPTYNRVTYVQEAIESVFYQTYNDYEIIVVDDGSDDGTDDVLQYQFGDKISYIWQENQGESRARNRGIEIARGEYIAFLDSDDLWLSDKLLHQVPILQEKEEVGLVFCLAQQIDAFGNVVPGTIYAAEGCKKKLDFTSVILGNPFPSGTVLLRRTLIDIVGGFDARLRYAEDWDLWLRLVNETKFHCVNKILASIRVHGEGQWFFPKKEFSQQLLDDHLKIIEGAFDRKPDNVDIGPKLKSKVLAKEYANAAWTNYVSSDFTLAREQLESAIILDREKWFNCAIIEQAIIDKSVIYRRLYPGEMSDPRSFVESVLSHLPESLSKCKFQRRRLIACIEIEMGHYWHSVGKIRLARQHLLNGIRYEPTWLKNPGTLSALLETIFSAFLVTSIKYLRHLLFSDNSNL